MIHADPARCARSHWPLALLLVGGCGSVQSGAADAGADAVSTTCSPSGKFGALVPVPGLANPSLDESTPRLSPDELTVYFTVRMPDTAHPGSVLDANLYVGHRATVHDAFTTQALDALNTASEDQDPTVSSDGLTLWYSSLVANEGYHTFVAHRASTSDPFGAPALAANINSADKTKDDGQDFVTADGAELWFTSTRDPTAGGNDIWKASLAGSAASPAVSVSELSSASNDWLPVLSADRLTVYFSSNRPGSTIGHTGTASYDIWTSHRASATGGFPEPTRVPELSTTADDFTGWLSPDNCRIYLSSIDSAGQHLDIFMATRDP